MDATSALFQDDLDVPSPGEEASDQDSGQLQPNTVARVPIVLLICPLPDRAETNLTIDV